MAMTQTGERGLGNRGEEIQNMLRDQRRRVEELARMLSQQSMEQWQRAVEGIVALPAALVTGAAAGTLYAVGFVTRGFEVFGEAANEQRNGQRFSWQSEREQRERGDQQRRTNEQRMEGGGEQPGQERPRA